MGWTLDRKLDAQKGFEEMNDSQRSLDQDFRVKDQTSHDLVEDLFNMLNSVDEDLEAFINQNQESSIFYYILTGLTATCTWTTIVMGIVVYIRLNNMIFEESVKVQKLKKILETFPTDVRVPKSWYEAHAKTQRKNIR